MTSYSEGPHMDTSDPVFSLLTDSDDLLDWAAKIKPAAPESASIHNALVLAGRGHTDLYNFYVVDDGSAHIVLLKYRVGQNRLSFFCSNSTSSHAQSLLLEALIATELIDWHAPFGFFYVPPHLSDIVLEASSAKAVVDGLMCSQVDLYEYDGSSEKFKVMARTAMGRMGCATVQQMHDTWQNRACLKLDKLQRFCRVVPNAAVYSYGSNEECEVEAVETDLPHADDRQTALAWCCTTMCGTLGMFGMDESVRDKVGQEIQERLLQQVMHACAQAMQRDNLVAHYYREPKGDVPLHLPPFRLVGHVNWLWPVTPGRSQDGRPGEMIADEQ